MTTTAAEFSLKPSTATPLSYVPETPVLLPTGPAAPLTPSLKMYPHFDKVAVDIPEVMLTIPGIVPQEWAVFQKHVINYNLLVELYKPDLDWKKAHLHELTDAKALAEYHLHIG